MSADNNPIKELELGIARLSEMVKRMKQDNDIDHISEKVIAMERNNDELCKRFDSLYERFDGYTEKVKHELKITIAAVIPVAVTAATLIFHFIAR
jgi:hypothetical protein